MCVSRLQTGIICVSKALKGAPSVGVPGGRSSSSLRAPSAGLPNKGTPLGGPRWLSPFSTREGNSPPQGPSPSSSSSATSSEPTSESLLIPPIKKAKVPRHPKQHRPVERPSEPIRTPHTQQQVLQQHRVRHTRNTAAALATHNQPIMRAERIPDTTEAHSNGNRGGGSRSTHDSSSSSSKNITSSRSSRK